MLRYILMRIVNVVVVMALIGTTVFFSTALIPGTAASVILGPDASPERIAAVTARLGLDKPLPIRYLRWAAALLQGDLGDSILSKEPITKQLSRSYRPTLVLSLASVLLSLLVALPLGIMVAARRGTTFDRVTMFFSMVGLSVPGYWTGLICILVFAVNLGWLPPSGYTSPFENPIMCLRQIIMPASCLAFFLAPALIRFVRSSILEALANDYIRTARAKGLSERKVLFRHALRNALIPVVTFIGLQIGSILGGSVLIEEIFIIPGVGRLVMNAIMNRDYPAIQGVVLVMAVVYTFINLIVDVLYAFIDPRIRFAEAGK